jgi:hypothetical protein
MYDAGSGNVGRVLVPPMCINNGLSSICHCDGIKLDSPTGIDRVRRIQSRPIEIA